MISFDIRVLAFDEGCENHRHVASWNALNVCKGSFQDHRTIDIENKKQIRDLLVETQGQTCLTATLIRTELTEPSIRTFSFWLRLITTGLSNNCFDDLSNTKKNKIDWIIERLNILDFNFGFIVSFDNLWFEVFDAECSLKSRSNSVEIWLMSWCLEKSRKQSVKRKIQTISTYSSWRCWLGHFLFANETIGMKREDKRKESHKWLFDKQTDVSRTVVLRWIIEKKQNKMIRHSTILSQSLLDPPKINDE